MEREERGGESDRVPVGAPAGAGGERICGRLRKGSEQSEIDSGPRLGPRRKHSRCVRVTSVGSGRGVWSGKGKGGGKER